MSLSSSRGRRSVSVPVDRDGHGERDKEGDEEKECVEKTEGGGEIFVSEGFRSNHTAKSDTTTHLSFIFASEITGGLMNGID